MSLTDRQERYLSKISHLVEAIQEEAKKSARGPSKTGGKRRKRRTAADAAKMRAVILAERAKGTSAAKLAMKFGVSTAYIYMIKE